MIFPEKIDTDEELSRFDFTRCQSKEDATSVVKKSSKLMILGKPGAEKTTFLKFMALHFKVMDQPSQLPIYVALKEFSESGSKFDFDLQKFIINKFKRVDIEKVEERIVNLLKSGRCLILLDGLYEVIEANVDNVCGAIEQFIKSHPENRFILSCLVGASKYRFEDFTEVEIADFEKWQVEHFSRKWFEANSGSELAGKFLTRLAENLAFRELATSPLLLKILCCIFDKNYSFPKNRHVLFAEAVDILIRRWDASRRIDRDPIFSVSDKLSRPRKLTLFGEMAYGGFEQISPNFVWREHEIEKIIRDFIRDIPGIKLDKLDIDTREVVKALEAHHVLLV